MAEVNINVELGTRTKRAELRSPDEPFRIAVLGDFSGGGNRRKPVLVDPDSFEEVMDGLQVGVQLPDAGKLRFRELDDFHPDRLFENVPLFQSLRQARKELLNPQTFRVTAAKLQPGPAFAASSRLLDQIVESAPALASGDAAWDEVIRRIVAPHLVPTPDPRQNELIAQLDAAIGAQMRAILSHPEFQSIEAAWRSLFLLLRQLETGVDLKIYVVDISKKQLFEDLDGLGRLLVNEGPWAVIAGNYTFSPCERDCEALARIAAIAREAGAPFLAAMEPKLLGCDSIASTPDTDDWNTPVEAADMQAWERLRQLPDACWLGLAMPRFLLRLPYGKATSSSDLFDFEEMPQPPAHESYLWGNPAIACACLLGQSFNRQGWALKPGSVNRLEGMPVHSYKQGGASIMTPPAEIWITERFAERILEHGIMPLASVKHSDAVQLVRFQSISHPARALAGPWT